MPLSERFSVWRGGLFRFVGALTARRRRLLLGEIVQVRGLMPLLMKPRNRQPWTPDDKQELVARLRRLSSLSPYLVALALPGGALMLPALSWWLDRRRKRHRASQTVPH